MPTTKVVLNIFGRPAKQAASSLQSFCITYTPNSQSRSLRMDTQQNALSPALEQYKSHSNTESHVLKTKPFAHII